MIRANDGNDTIYGEVGDDTIYAGTGDDKITGGTGNDYMNGDTGNDVYYLNLGDGNDTISDYENSTTSGRDDRIVFGEGIRPEDVYMERIGYNLYIRYSETDSVTIQDAYYNSDGRYQVENMEFIDNSMYSINYNDLDLSLVERGYSMNEEELLDTYTDTIASTIIDTNVDNMEVNTLLTDSTDNIDVLVESMTNLTVQEMSTIPSDNVVDSIDTCVAVNEDNNSQLWIEK